MAEKIRRISTCAPDHECTPEEISELAREIFEINNDPDIRYYSLPNLSEMQEIIEIAENYTGTWYHSTVVLLASIEDADTQALKIRIAELGDSHGINLLWEYSDKDLDNLLNVDEEI